MHLQVHRCSLKQAETQRSPRSLTLDFTEKCVISQHPNFNINLNTCLSGGHKEAYQKKQFKCGDIILLPLDLYL